jgi:hypothetical protein
MEAEKYQKWIFRISLLLCVASLFVVLSLGYTYVHSPSQLVEAAEDNAQNQAEVATKEIDRELSELKKIPESIATDLTNGELEDHQVVERLKDTIEEHPEFFGISAVYTPYAYDPEKKLYAPYYVRKNNELELIQIEDVYDYTQPDPEDGAGPRTAWYHQTLAEDACWIEPYYGTAGKTFMVDYNVLFYRTNLSTQEKVPAGFIGAEYSLDGIRDIVGSLDLGGDTGYGFILSEKGTVVSHPIQEYLGKEITDLQKSDETLRAISQTITHVKHHDIDNTFTGQTSCVFYDSIPSTNWTLGVVFVEDELLGELKPSQQRLEIKIAVAVMAFLFFLSILLFRAYKGSSGSLWAVAIFFSLLCISGVWFMWYLALQSEEDPKNLNDVEIYDRVGLETALHKYLENSEGWTSENQLIRVPTGVFLQSMKFTSANNVIVTGYIWQNYSENITGEISPGVIFPEAEEIELEEAYNTTGEVIGWHFRAELRQQFDYSRYPFDCEDVWIRLWPNDFRQNVILTPDFNSYDAIRPDYKPGLEQDFVLEGWDVQNSYFSYRKGSYNTTFGIPNYDRDLPELYFNVGIKRDFMSPFISDMIPPVVVAFLLFAVLMISTKHEERIATYGFSSSAVLAYCAALFFVLILSHAALREDLATHGIIYLEYFYFIMYFAILAVSVNSILLASGTTLTFITYQDNLIAKLLYWPVILGVVFGITLAVFY